jgi:LPXTG-site transpeptidase (sortase) family protein
MNFPRPGRRRSRAVAGALVIVGLGAAGLAGCGGTTAPTTSSTSRPKASAPAVTAAGQAKTLGRSLPVRLNIPKIGVHAPVSTLGLKSDGTIQEPPLSKPNLTGWYRLGPTPGEQGPAVIAGHVDANGEHAVFYRLKQLRKGDKVTVTRKDGSVATFVLDVIQQVPKDAFPTKKVYGDIGFPGLRLITCGGGFDKRTGHYIDNVIAYGHLVAGRT